MSYIFMGMAGLHFAMFAVSLEMSKPGFFRSTRDVEGLMIPYQDPIFWFSCLGCFIASSIGFTMGYYFGIRDCRNDRDQSH